MIFSCQCLCLQKRKALFALNLDIRGYLWTLWDVFTLLLCNVLRFIWSINSIKKYNNWHLFKQSRYFAFFILQENLNSVRKYSGWKSRSLVPFIHGGEVIHLLSVLENLPGDRRGRRSEQGGSADSNNQS